MRRDEEQEARETVLGKQQEKVWGWGKAVSDPTAALKGLGLAGGPWATLGAALQAAMLRPAWAPILLSSRLAEAHPST